ncbi:diguanylate phosphodiesterase [Pseudarthrobacter chlorophenolicus A6]|uniref:Diguanylate phosphodiesterase n=2 Tax=Pseudarthrobacter chlorophenolicus TaxID=85085 RepID=B8H6V7_PSECP|nr:diguanylate phosphodiesterase [Pseudarthrobacter chlorophenolicus A6]SDQ95568.1 EAL domain, c-di-GMP-specific phosphodiesterase class I (or its enzymatically inactive variant) [Pseudarthrobacter chlorophenolicus]
MLEAACIGIGVRAAYQPIVGTERGDVVGYEALIRFPGYEEKSPQVWFTQARAAGMADQLEALALRTALAARPTLPENCFLALNVSPDLLTNPKIRNVWKEQGDLSGLVIELTEQSRIESYTWLEPDLNQLRHAGALIAVDDAGAGYAGLRHLLALRPAIIKLDRELVQGLQKDEAKRALIEMLGVFASRVDAWILAEGVEQAEELDALAALRVPLVQGYYLAQPSNPWAQPAADVRVRLRAQSTATRTSTVSALVEPALTASTIAEAGSIFSEHFLVDWVVLIDHSRRPVSVLSPESTMHGLTLSTLKANARTPILAALDRAVTREPGVRFSPLMITDDNGSLVGIVRMERLITTLTATATVKTRG